MAFVKNSFFILTVIIMFLISQSDIAFADEVEFASSPNPVGSGARALGMGGAFIGVADDATAASWNPGGLFQVETPEISFVGDWFHRTEDNTFGGHPESNGPEVVSKEAVNYFSMTYPFRRFDRTMVVSLNYQRLYDFTRERNYRFIATPEKVDNDTTQMSDQYTHYKQNGALSAIGIAYCTQLSKSLSVGVTLNFWNDFFNNNKWEQHYHFYSEITEMEKDIKYLIDSDRTDQFSFRGFNANMGMMWRTGKLDIGMVFKFPFTGDLKHEYREISTINRETSVYCNEYDEKLSMPMSYGIGFAYRFSNDDVTIAGDVYRTEWQDFVQTKQGKDISPITGGPADEANIKPTAQIRVGIEWLLYRKHIPEEKEWYIIPVRAGVFYDPAPIRGGGKDVYWGFTLGTGYGCRAVLFDIAYQYRTGKDVGASMFDKSSYFFQDVDEHKIYASVIVRFKKNKQRKYQY